MRSSGDRHYRRNRGRWVPAQVVWSYVDAAVPGDKQYQRLVDAGVDPRIRGQIERGERDWLEVDTADRIICRVLGDVGLWHRVPELAEVYERC